ncbi:GDSL esterase/lipase At5g08460-like [Andrographis paniculata]|uniref:GDSL esterase/lipase At5g08460-like n=1 Tax=Andrographis paniculata TaxID=175694 RepID=UPI0021E6F104|nr:GDSL esterase/lipase At5g08460-like [Andrographis paniculata]
MEIHGWTAGFLLATILSSVDAAAELSAMFVFGDSLMDPGNNNYLSSTARADFLPYGIDFFAGPSGRFCNGKTVVDYLGDLLGIPLLPAYASPFSTGKSILRGVNYASAAGGILEETGKTHGERFSLSQQVDNFESTLNELRVEMRGDEEQLKSYLSKALVVMSLGSNDYINNYLQPSYYTSSYLYTPQDYASLLINRYATQILRLESLGLKKFVLGGIGPLGCIPNQLARNEVQGECVVSTNNAVAMFNHDLKSLVDKLNNNNNNGSIFAYGNIYGAFMDILNNGSTNGLKVRDRGCCGLGKNRGQITCLPMLVPCSNRQEYVFWDAFHPTQVVNQMLASRAHSGTQSDCYPLNIQQIVASI